MLCTSSPVYDVMFGHNGVNRPEPKMMRTFRPVCQVVALGAKPAISILLLLYFLTLSA